MAVLEDNHLIALKTPNGYLWVSCDNPSLYSRMMNEEFGIDKIIKQNPNHWARKVWKEQKMTR